MRHARPLLIILAGGLAHAACALAANPPPTTPPAAAQSVPPRPAPAGPLKPLDRELHFVVTMEAEQSWKKNDPEHPGDQWSKATAKGRYEVTARLRSDGKLEVRNLLADDMNERLEAKTIRLARIAKKEIEASGQPLVIPQTDAEEQAISRRYQYESFKCNGDAVCLNKTNLRFASILAAMQYPEALQEDTVPGQYYYFLPYPGCTGTSRVTMAIDINGVRYNKTVKRFVPFAEHREADSVNLTDGQPLCDHFVTVLDTQEPVRPLAVENAFIPSPFGTTSYTELEHTQKTDEPQPIPEAVRDWVTATLRHAGPRGSSSATLPLPLSLNGNSTWLGLWTGTVKVTLQWSFTDPATRSAP